MHTALCVAEEGRGVMGRALRFGLRCAVSALLFSVPLVLLSAGRGVLVCPVVSGIASRLYCFISSTIGRSLSRRGAALCYFMRGALRGVLACVSCSALFRRFAGGRGGILEAAGAGDGGNDGDGRGAEGVTGRRRRRGRCWARRARSDLIPFYCK